MMTQNEILAMLTKIIAENQQFTTWTVSTPHLVALVNQAVEQEREACAQVCDDLYRAWTLTSWEDDLNQPDALDCKRAIRAKGKT